MATRRGIVIELATSRLCQQTPRKGARCFLETAFATTATKARTCPTTTFTIWALDGIPDKKQFADKGRYDVTKEDKDLGTFKTPGLRDVSKRAPYMHDGSVKTLEEVVKLYSKGGIPNPNLDRKVDRRFAEQLDFTETQVQQLVAFMKSLDGEGYQDSEPTAFPQ